MLHYNLHIYASDLLFVLQKEELAQQRTDNASNTEQGYGTGNHSNQAENSAIVSSDETGNTDKNDLIVN